MVWFYLQHLLVFSLVLCHRDAANIMVELLIEGTATNQSVMIFSEGLRLLRNCKA